jgi:hypothetical protein
MGMNYDPYVDYGSDEVVESSEPNPEDLDVVDCAACINIAASAAAAKDIGCKPLIFAVECLQGRLNHFRNMVRGKQMGKQHSKSMMLPFILLLVTWGIATEVLDHSTAFWCICPVFVVAKSAGKLRLIFDGRAFNKQCDIPPPVSLPTISDIFERIGHRKIAHIILGDFRHYFHQFALPTDLQGKLGVSVEDSDTGKMRYFKYCTLPMGLSWSPFLAQAHSWLVLFSKQKGSKRVFDSSSFDLRLSPFAPVLDGDQVVGFSTIIYDNVGIFFFEGTKADVIEQVEKRLIGNARNLGVRWKELRSFTPAGSRCLLKPRRDRSGKFLLEPIPPVFLGVELDLASPTFRWRHCKKREEKASLVGRMLKENSLLTPRMIAVVVGLLIWDACVALKRLGALKGIIDGIKVFKITRKRDWDIISSQPSSSWRQAAILYLAEVEKNPWRTYDKPQDDASSIRCASDASDILAGGVIYTPEGPLLVKYSERLETHIFLKEVLAASNVIHRAIRYARSRNSSGDSERRFSAIILAIDNSPARRAFEKGYSSNDAANSIISRTLSLLDEAGFVLFLKDIASEYNVADCITRNDGEGHPKHIHRGSDLCPTRYQKTWEILIGACPGRGEPCALKGLKISDDPLFVKQHEAVGGDGDWLSDVVDAAAHDI